MLLKQAEGELARPVEEAYIKQAHGLLAVRKEGGSSQVLKSSRDLKMALSDSPPFLWGQVPKLLKCTFELRAPGAFISLPCQSPSTQEPSGRRIQVSDSRLLFLAAIQSELTWKSGPRLRQLLARGL